MNLPNPIKNPEGILFQGFITIKDFETYFLNRGIKRYPKFNRKKVWKETDIQKLKESIFDNDFKNPIVLVPTKDSIYYAITRGNEGDEEFFKNAYENGKNEFLTLIGGNRGESIQKILMSNDEKHNKEFRRQQIPIMVTEPLTRHEIHRKFQKDLCGVPPNRQEQRNSIWVGEDCESDWVRKMSKDYGGFITAKNCIKADTIRMKDDEFVANLLYYSTYQVFGNVNGNKRDDNIDYLYGGNSTRETRSSTKKKLEFLKRIYNSHELPKNNYNFYQGLIVICQYMEDENLTWYDRGSAKELFNKYTLWFDKKCQSNKIYRVGKNKTRMLFERLILNYTATTGSLVEMKKLLNSFTEEMVKEKVLKLDMSDRLATPEEHISLLQERLVGDEVWIRQNGKVGGKWFAPQSEMPEFTKLDYSEVKNNRTDYPVDHIQPKDEDDEAHEIDNMEITTESYNNWKRNRIPNYSKFSLDEIV